MAAPHLPVHLALHQSWVSCHAALPTLFKDWQVLHRPFPCAYRVGDVGGKIYRVAVRKVGWHGEELLQCSENSETYLCCRYALGDVHCGLVKLGNRWTVCSCGHAAHVAEIVPQGLAASVHARHVHHLVAEMLVREQGVQVSVELCKCCPTLHLLNVVEYHAECVRTHHVKGEIIASALDNAAC